MSKMDTSKYIKELKKKFNDTLDYSKVSFTNLSTAIILICKIHNTEFTIQAGRILSRCKFGCPNCVRDNKKKLSKSLEKFIAESNKKHNNKFENGFKDSVYVNSNTSIIYECPIHGKVTMTPYYHLNGSETGCNKCSGLSRRTQDEFILEAIQKHDGYYTYTRCVFVNMSTKVIITCPVHGDFEQTPSMHLHEGQGCMKCATESISDRLRWTMEEIIEKVKTLYTHNESLLDDYSNALVERVDDVTYVKNIRCIRHNNMYDMRADSHTRGSRCRECKKDTLSAYHRLPYATLITRCKEVHKDKKYEYNMQEPVDYKNGNSKIEVSCGELDSTGRVHGKWFPSAHNHLNGSDCPRCYKSYSKKSICWLESISRHIGIEIQHKLTDDGEFRIENTRYDVDGYYKPKRVVFEFHGCAYHGCVTCYPEREELDMFGKKTMDELYTRTQKKKDHCIQQGYNYIEMWECKWDMISQQTEELQAYLDSMKREIESYDAPT